MTISEKIFGDPRTTEHYSSFMKTEDGEISLEDRKKWFYEFYPNGEIAEEVLKVSGVPDCRAIYANRLYVKYAPPANEINERNRIPTQRKNKSRDGLVSPIIRLQGDLLGVALCRKGCRTVSKCLGHEREEIFQNSYFAKTKYP